MASPKVGLDLGSWAIGTLGRNLGPIEAGGKDLYEVEHTPSQNIIERGRTICECDEIMQISPRFD